MKRLQCKYSREWIDFDIEVTSSGEATIWKSSQKPGVLGKEYHANLINLEKEEKLDVMVKNPPADPTKAQGHISLAWPKDLLIDASGIFVGFLMPEITNSKTLIHVYNPKKRKQNDLQEFNWLYLHITAQNLASAIQAVHDRNYVIGDIKSLNILVNASARVSLVDTDSFQIRARRTGKIYRCPVGTADYTPSEMVGHKFGTVDLSEFHDRFGLAVIIWQLLFGEHPFDGQWIGGGEYPPIQKRIKEGHWMYGSRSQIKPKKSSPPITILHPQLQQCFRQCFDAGHKNPSARPSAADWKTALDAAIKDLTKCSSEPNHYYAKSSAKCYWWRCSGKCYWCKRKRLLNHDIFALPQQPNHFYNKLFGQLYIDWGTPGVLIKLLIAVIVLLVSGRYFRWQLQFDTSGFKKVVLSEDFKSFDPKWALARGAAFKNGGLFQQQPDVNRAGASIWEGKIFTDIDVSVDVQKKMAPMMLLSVYLLEPLCQKTLGMLIT